MRVPCANRRDPAGWKTTAVVVLVVDSRRQRDGDGHTVLAGTVQLCVGGVHIVRTIGIDHVVLSDEGQTLATVARGDGPTEQAVEEGSVTVVTVSGTMMSTAALAGITVAIVAEHHPATVGVEPCDPLFAVLWLVNPAVVCLPGIQSLHDAVPGMPTAGGMTEATMIGSRASVMTASVSSVGDRTSSSRAGESAEQARGVSVSTMTTVAKETVASVAKQPMAAESASAMTVAAFAGI